MFLLKFIPKNILSYFIGKLTEIYLPRPFNIWLNSWFAKKYNVNLDEAEKSLSSYRSLQQFFTRNLKKGSRSIDSGVVSPVDGALRSFGNIKNRSIEQIKGKDYSLVELLGEDEIYKRFVDGTHFHLYLAPGDYHHIHSPVDGKIIKASHIHGTLWPVNDWSLKNIDKLYSVNERIITYIDSRYGLVAVVKVGATNVGKITLEYDNLIGNNAPFIKNKAIKHLTREYGEDHSVSSGQRIASFKLGSTVILLFERGRVAPIETITTLIDGKVSYGQKIADKI